MDLNKMNNLKQEDLDSVVENINISLESFLRQLNHCDDADFVGNDLMDVMKVFGILTNYSYIAKINWIIDYNSYFQMSPLDMIKLGRVNSVMQKADTVNKVKEFEKL